MIMMMEDGGGNRKSNSNSTSSNSSSIDDNTDREGGDGDDTLRNSTSRSEVTNNDNNDVAAVAAAAAAAAGGGIGEGDTGASESESDRESGNDEQNTVNIISTTSINEMSVEREEDNNNNKKKDDVSNVIGFGGPPTTPVMTRSSTTGENHRHDNSTSSSTSTGNNTSDKTTEIPTTHTPTMIPTYTTTMPRTPQQQDDDDPNQKQQQHHHHQQQQNQNHIQKSPLSSSSSKAPSLLTPNRNLRRKVSVEQETMMMIDNAVAVQRLVEYFVVISSHPRRNYHHHHHHRHHDHNHRNGDNNNNNDDNKNPNTTSNTTPPDQQQQQQQHSNSNSYGGASSTPIEQRNNDGNTESRNKPIGASENIHLPVYSFCGDNDAATATAGDGGGGGGGGIGTGSNENTTTTDDASLPIQDTKFGPKITARYPFQDHNDNPLNPMITQFCFPRGELIVPTQEYKLPSVHHFVLTNDRGRKVYGNCLTFYEEYTNNNTNNTNKNRNRNKTTNSMSSSEHKVDESGEGSTSGVELSSATYYVPKCLCILSIWPYVTAFREYLAQLYRLATATDCMTAPIERYVLNICMEIPAPPPGAFEVRLSIFDSVIRFWSPPAKLPAAYVALPYQTLFDCLDIDNILQLWYCLTLEHQIVLVSSQDSILTVCSEILCSLLFPIKWSHLYVPMLPSLLSPMLDAPVPYLVGVPRDNWDEAQHHLSAEAIVVDLDHNSVVMGKQTAELPPVPGKKWTKLQTKVEEVAGHLFWKTRGLETEYQQFAESKWAKPNFHQLANHKGGAVWEKKLETFDHAFNLQYTPDSEHLLVDGKIEQEQSQWDQVQEAFLRYFVALFKTYRNFLHIPDSTQLASPEAGSNDWIQWNDNHSFDKSGFIASEKPEYTDYLEQLCATQQFDEFITKRLYSPELPDIVFFDQSIDAKLNRSRLKLKKVETPFLQSAQTHKKLETFDAVKPNDQQLPMPDGSDGKPFVYHKWPETFEMNLFCEPRPIPSIITAEFDRQASLIMKLHRTRSETSLAASSRRDLYGYDYDTSPEGMAFTVFFFAYSAVIGQEWQKYKMRQEQSKKRTTSDNNGHPSEANGNDNNARVSEAAEKIEDSTDEQFCSSSNIFSDFTLGLCGDGGITKVLDNACSYVTSANPCPNFDGQAQTAYDTLNNLAMSFDRPEKSRQTSLIDQAETSAEYQEVWEVAVAQLDLGFDALTMMESRGLLADTDVFKSLMEACGRCRDTKRALDVIERMKREGIVAHGDILASFMESFIRYDAAGAKDTLKKSVPTSGRRGSDAYSHFLKKNFRKMKGGKPTSDSRVFSDDDESNYSSDFGSESGSEKSSLSGLDGAEAAINTSSFTELFSSSFSLKESGVDAAKKKKQRKRKSRRRSSVIKGGMKVDIPDRIRKQLVLGDSLLEFLYPDINIETFGDACPHCSNVMTEDDIVNGWQPGQFQDFTTSCPQCQHRFVPRFKVSTSSPTFEGSQGQGTPLFCEFLSPWVLRKELDHIIRGRDGDVSGIERMLDPDWRNGRDIQATIWWNLLLMFQRHGLPFSFLLQGSFQNRLISPVP